MSDPLSKEAIENVARWAAAVLDTAKRIGPTGAPSQRFAETILALVAEREAKEACPLCDGTGAVACGCCTNDHDCDLCARRVAA